MPTADASRLDAAPPPAPAFRQFRTLGTAPENDAIARRYLIINIESIEIPLMRK
jgi:hypothetical protein